MKNICIVIPSLKGGGAEKVVSNITINLPKDKYKIFLILFDSSSIEYPYEGELIDLDIKASNNILIKTINFIRRYFKIKKIKRKYEIDTSISFLGGPNLLNILTRDKDKVIVSVRGYVSNQPKGFYTSVGKYLIRRIYNNSDVIVAVSNLIKHDLEKNYNLNRNKMLTIYNPYDIDKINKLSEKDIEHEYESIFKSKVIITVGRLNYLKGHWHLIRAFKKVSDCNKEVKLVILGEGELKEYLQRLINDLNLNNKVYLLGFKNNPYKYIKNSYVFVLPSLSEGFPNALAEAMACGVPVIASDCKSGPREILAPRTSIEYQCSEIEYAQSGILIPVCDGTYYEYDDPLTKEENIMANAILELMSDTNLYKKYSDESIMRVKDFEVNRIIKSWRKIL